MNLFRKSHIKINVKGGILSPGTLKSIVQVARIFRMSSLSLGERQHIYLRTFVTRNELFRNRKYFDAFDFEINADVHPNIMSSYVAEDIFTSASNWLTESVYNEVLDGLDFKPKLKINVVDTTQGLVPLFTGHLNFISSKETNFWYLYINHPSLKGMQCWPDLVYTGDIPALAKALEVELIVNETLGGDLWSLKKLIVGYLKLNVLQMKEEVSLPRLRFPIYEGMNKQGESYWLGIYRRNNDFPVEFLEKVAQLCVETKIGSLYLTPFKSLLIKGIKEEDRIKWEKLLGKYGINIRHNISELNWKIPDLDEEALKLKNFLSRELDSVDVRTYGLTFAIQNKPVEKAASVLIEKRHEIDLFGFIKLIPNYNIYYTSGFDPNGHEFKLFVAKRPKLLLAEELLYLCKKYYAQLTHGEEVSVAVEKREVDVELVKEEKQYICQECFTHYDEAYGDSMQKIEAGTSFESLPSTWHCPVCEAPKSSFQSKRREKTKPVYEK